MPETNDFEEFDDETPPPPAVADGLEKIAFEDDLAIGDVVDPLSHPAYVKADGSWDTEKWKGGLAIEAVIRLAQLCTRYRRVKGLPLTARDLLQRHNVQFAPDVETGVNKKWVDNTGLITQAFRLHDDLPEVQVMFAEKAFARVWKRRPPECYEKHPDMPVAQHRLSPNWWIKKLGLVNGIAETGDAATDEMMKFLAASARSNITTNGVKASVAKAVRTHAGLVTTALMQKATLATLAQSEENHKLLQVNSALERANLMLTHAQKVTNGLPNPDSNGNGKRRRGG